MSIHPGDRVMIFVDGANLGHTMKNVGFELDFTRLAEMCSKPGRLIAAYYYTGVTENVENPLVRMLDYLSFNGWRLVTKPIRVMNNFANGTSIRKGNMDVELVIDMMRHAPHYDHAVLFSGDGDFCALVRHLQGLGKRVTIGGSYKSTPKSMSDELRKQGDAFIELMDMQAQLARDPKDRVKAGLRRSTDASEVSASQV